MASVAVKHAWFSSPHDGAAALKIDPGYVYDTTIAHAQPGNLPLLAARSPQLFGRSKFVACVSYWETHRIKRLHSVGSPFFDEVWTPSQFSQMPLAEMTRKPVRVFPYPVVAPTAQAGAWRRYLGLGDEFVFSFQFDMASTTQRKNPQGVIDAFIRAFPKPNSDTVLLIKTMNSTWFPEQYRVLAELAASRLDVRLVDEFWPEPVNDAYYHDIDCYVSLHRAEGLGIGMARAMAAGTAVIATGYSGNLDFMDPTNSLLVPHRTVLVGDNPVYPSNSKWAEPDVDYAADAMRLIRKDPGLRNRLGARAAADLSSRTYKALGEWIVEHSGLSCSAVRDSSGDDEG